MTSDWNTIANSLESRDYRLGGPFWSVCIAATCGIFLQLLLNDRYIYQFSIIFTSGLKNSQHTYSTITLQGNTTGVWGWCGAFVVLGVWTIMPSLSDVDPFIFDEDKFYVLRRSPVELATPHCPRRSWFLTKGFEKKCQYTKKPSKNCLLNGLR